MDKKLNHIQIVLDDFKKTVDDLAKELATQKQNDAEIQFKNLRQEVKDLRQAAATQEQESGAPASAAATVPTPSSLPDS